ncbi:MAG TPA: hypothetical protein VNU20_01000 [Candidatus Sulfotelmatobacter sp.]|jgi:plasmid maintenance system antidote protein VapI|nr:hypothetical protein [Candidatus Sulfotelmatobacter sp.]
MGEERRFDAICIGKVKTRVLKQQGCGTRRITAETALRLARYFKTNAEFWLNLQNFYDLECERRAGKASEIERQVQPVGAE